MDSTNLGVEIKKYFKSKKMCLVKITTTFPKRKYTDAPKHNKYKAILICFAFKNILEQKLL